MKRGDAVNETGKFVGQSGRSSMWVWYPGSDQSFDAMCALFDIYYAR